MPSCEQGTEVRSPFAVRGPRFAKTGQIRVRPQVSGFWKVNGAGALAHLTGGGISENLNRALNERVDAQVDLGTWPVPAVAKYVCDAAELSEPQALKTFNMGVGMILIVDPARADEVEAALAEAGEKTYRVGRIVSGTGEVQYTGEGNLYGYQG